MNNHCMVVKPFLLSGLEIQDDHHGITYLTPSEKNILLWNHWTIANLAEYVP